MAPPSLFDETAAAFAASTDQQLARDRYLRGQHFVDAVLATTAAQAYILDYGCGPGRLAQCIGRHDRRVLGVDTSERMIEQARRLMPGDLPVRFDLCKGNGDDLLSNTFDAVVCSSVIEYIKDCQHLLNNFRRCLKAGGTLILSYANRYSLWRTYAKWKTAGQQPHYALQHNVWNRLECKRHLRSSGFEVFGKPRYFDSPLDQYPMLALAGRLQAMGTLGLITARRS
jgi:2-polyprenyl-3-methyl-5-hydroxy-6-metoxy-1,4-benzoquinol methylase